MRRIIAGAALALLLTSCAGVVSTSPTAVPSDTAAPTDTAVPSSTPTALPTDMAEAPTVFALPSPSGEPLTEWEGIPVMPGAIAGETKSNGYAFTIEATPDQIKGYYDDALLMLGWNKFMTGKSEQGPSMLLYSNGSTTASILITPQDGDTARVVIVK